MSKYFAFWHGGASYAPPRDSSGEWFNTLAEVREALVHRRNGGDPFYPGVDDTSYIVIVDPETLEALRGFEFGPRGGVTEIRFT